MKSASVQQASLLSRLSCYAGLLFSCASCGTVDLAEEGDGESGILPGDGLQYVNCCFVLYFGTPPDENNVCDYNEGCHAVYACADKDPECMENYVHMATTPDDINAFCQQKCDAYTLGASPWGDGAVPDSDFTYWPREGSEPFNGLPYEVALEYDQDIVDWVGCHASQPQSPPEGAVDETGDPPDNRIMCTNQLDGCLSSDVHSACEHSIGLADPEPCGWFLASNADEVTDSCPPLEELVDYPSLAAPPTHGAFFDTRDGEIDIDVSGYSMGVAYNVTMGLALDNCQGGGVDGGTCDLVISQFTVDITEITMLGTPLHFDITAHLRMPDPAIAEVFFQECANDICSGDFEFSVGEENPLAFVLSWTQINSSNAHSSNAAVRLSNDGNSLGGVDAVYGTVAVDPTAQSGVLVLSGSAEDTLGTEDASVDFMMLGFIETIDPDPGDCCETHLTGGCSNDYIKVCVATRIQSCNFTEWDAGCVSAVEDFSCGFCPE